VSPYEELRLLLTTLVEGEQRSGEMCPFCRGGRSGEGSLSLVRHAVNAGAYKCNRAACGKEGYIGERYGTHYRPPAQQIKPEWAPRIYDGTIEEVPDDIIKQYSAKYGWSEEDLRASGCGWSPEYRRTTWKVCAPDGFVRGIELRTLNPQSRAKTLHFRHSADPWVGYVGVHQRTGEKDPGGRKERETAGEALLVRERCLVAVEDLLSAYRVRQVYPAASIMGSHITFETLVDLMKVSENLVLVLDRDATEKAEKFAKRYSFLCPGFVHIPITRDLKYESPEKIKEILAPALG
jgi:hypothetical protein